MIAIVNVSTGPAIGKQDYELYINHELITTFTHVREEGLAQCLRQAAMAVDRKDMARLAQQFSELDKE